MGERRGTKGLELWCRKMTEGYPGVKVDNMTTSWRDGLAFCAIIHHFRPDLIEFDKLNKDDIYHNNELAFTVAEHHLGIPALLEPADMLEYEVPDRLSILTYLSQFYQTFENQRGKSGARMAPKRPQSTPDHGIVSPASTSPPTKVQITVGRARREPCAKCGFPVFIAERLNVGKLLYHRTCFRCARCSSQLNLANYYETENGEFCCEICPDEEKQISKKISPDSVLTRSLSDEEKTASLQTYAEKPDAYSTHFESALEFPLDGDLKKSSTLTEKEDTEFTKARSHFFKSQMENSSESGSEDIPVELPKSKPPPLIKSQYEGEDIPFDLPKPKPPISPKPVHLRTHSSFPSDKKDNDKITRSDSEQTNDHFVTKDNASSSSRISVRARMKLFENNEDKSDVNKCSSSTNKVPLDSFKKKAAVVAIDDLEDFDNISRKDIDVEDTSSLKSSSSIKVHSDKVINESDIKSVTVGDEKIDIPKESNVDLRQQNLFTVKTELVINTNDLDLVDPTNQLPQSAQDASVIEILNSSEEAKASHITIDSEIEEAQNITQESCIIIDDSPALPETAISKVTASDDSFLSANSLVSPVTISSGDSPAPKRGYYTAYELLSSQEESALLENEEDRSDVKKDSGINEKFSENKYISTVNTELEDNIEETSHSEPKETFVEESSIIKSVEPDDHKDDSSTSIDVETQPPDTDTKQSIEPVTPDRHADVIEPEPNYPDDLNPFGDDDDNEAASTSEKSFGVSDDEKVTVSTRPVPAARPKKKIVPALEDWQMTGTPESLARTYVKKISLNPFEEDDSEEELANTSYNPFEEEDEEQKERVTIRQKKIVPSLEDRKMWAEPPKSINPFEDDVDEEEIEDPVKPVPVPTPRTSKFWKMLKYRVTRSSSTSALATKPDSVVVNDTASVASSKDSAYCSEIASRPEPKPRDTLSINSRGSHGGSNSSISSGSAFGSARKKKPAPRPPMPFLNSDSQSTAGSSWTSPSSSVVHSPNLSGTIRSRKTKRAPLPPNASTPSNPESKDFSDRLPPTLGISPINLERTGALSNDIQKEKTVKDEENRNRQSQIQSTPPDDSNLTDKSTAGRWKRRKAQAPSRPIPERRIVKSLPISEIKRELDTIEIQQQGLEKQGVRLEQIIREKCEGADGTNPEDQVPIEVEDLILQLFELVNEKNELFRRQTELMYLRRQQRLEEEHADVEYQIRCLMSQPEANKSDSDKVREETLINRLVEIVRRRDEIVECLEMDRRREAEEDNSISSQLNLYSAKRDGDKDQSKDDEKKDKKKKHKKLTKIIHTFKHKKEKDHKVDVDKDVDESEVNSSSEKGKKKKFNLF